ncbi:sensor histidine kinase [Paenibacillus sp. BC26]|uniref:sensor histidine kinase n=1 Tax=Paenibacillus sp. BC26 TaxID=1881032 RepID=UPI0008DFA772|nr:histidine kinase [Paenibacillus sp. BC26]SFT03722.1 two-component system, sensor histidine kinase YesM [Paenibacillus sp. BC26]
MNKWNTLGSRFILLFCAITIPLLIILFLVGSYAKSVVLTQVANSYQNLVNSNLNMIDRSLEDITTNMVDIVNNSDEFQRFGQPGLTDSDYYFAQMELIHRNTTYQSYYHTVDMFFVYSMPNAALYSTNLVGAASGYYEPVRAWIDSSFQRPDMLKQYLYKWSVIRIKDQYFLYRLVSDDLTNNAYIGAIININSLKTPLGNLDVKGGAGVLIVGDDGSVLSNPSAPLSTITKLPPDNIKATGSFTVEDGASKLLAVNKHSGTAGISYAVVVPNSELLSGLSRFQAVINFLPLLVFAILVLYLFIFRNILFNPIRHLLGAIRRIKEGDMSTRLPNSQIAEFAIINHTFNNMVEEITHLKIDVYEENLRAQQAELKHLQTQINPHFFLNTMNIIFQLADLKRNELVKKTVRHMVQYFRFSLRTKRDAIMLEQELEHIRNYLEIQKMRFQDSFNFEIHVPDDLLRAKLPSLIVQPFVENAMIHGMSVKNAPFILQLSARRVQGEQEMMEIAIEDNGKGMTAEKLAELNDDGYAPDSEDNHIGIWNVKKRLTMQYGSKAELGFYPNERNGVRIRLLLPIDYAEE